jgi:hypothetical protein
LFRIFTTALVGILSAALAVIFQNDIAAFFGRAPITAEITAGAWYPLPSEDSKNPYDKAATDAIRSYSDPSEVKFARIVIRNNTGKKAEDVYLKVDAEWADYDAVILRDAGGGKLERTIILGADNNIGVGEIPPADDTVVYLWSNRTFGYPFGFDEIYLVDGSGGVPTKIAQFEGATGEFVFGLSTETVAWVLVFIAVIIAFIILIILSHWASYVKALMKNEDYYLSERQRHDASPEKFTAPEKLPS